MTNQTTADHVVTRVLCSALDDAEQVGYWQRWDQASAILEALNRFGYSITTTEGETV